ncbi:MAG: flagellar hook-basal body complex protein [Alphaproteobacteria bacterium]|nr:flagellar hook-basal body complex protein [Alphaproteobacteria bacterium]
MSIHAYAGVALSMQKVLQHNLEITTDNISQLNTPGALSQELIFSKYLNKNQQIAFVEDKVSIKDLRPGPAEYTNDPYHVANTGRGFFSVQTPNGIRYTLNGAFRSDTEDQLVTQEGYPVLNDSGSPIVIPQDRGDIVISPDGTISNKDGPLDRIGVFEFENPYSLERAENTLFTSSETPIASEDIAIMQGYLTGSNVNPMEETTRLVWINRMYQMMQKLLEQESRLGDEAINRLIKIPPIA